MLLPVRSQRGSINAEEYQDITSESLKLVMSHVNFSFVAWSSVHRYTACGVYYVCPGFEAAQCEGTQAAKQ